MTGALRIACILIVAWLAPAAAQERVALVIGNSDYANVGTLKNPRNDASDMAIALEGLGFEVLLGTDLDGAGMRGIARRFTEAVRGADVALLYYAGHGFQVTGTNFLVPTDAAIGHVADVPAQTVSLNELVVAMDHAPGLKLVFLDACRDNPFGGGLEDPAGVESGLARVGSDADFLFSYATQPDNVAYDGTGRNSFFTEAVLNHIYTPGQDVSDMMIAVRRDVMAATGGQQIPWENSSLTRRFSFDTSPVTVSDEAMLWQVAADMGDPALMDLYLDRYPQGTYREEVLAFLDGPGASVQTRAMQTADTAGDDDRLWQLARRTRMRPLIEHYLATYPEGLHAGAARRLLASIPAQSEAEPGNVCRRLATHPRDATAMHAGVSFETLQRNALPAIQSCSAAAIQSPDVAHYVALLARATAASGDLDRAVQLYRQAAERGDLRAMVSLAQLHEAGTGVPQDPAAALALYERAAEGGSADALINLAVNLFEGAGVAQDTDRAIALLRRAAEGGSAKATFNLGVLAQQGAVDTPAAALDYFERAAREGEAQGYRAAAILLDEGRGVAADPDRAANLLLLGAAEDGGEIVAALTSAPEQWSPGTIVAVQERLAAAGYYAGLADGSAGPKFDAALRRWRNGGFDPQVLTQ